jgi:hypothetical protein
MSAFTSLAANLSTNLSRAVCSYLPQNIHAQKALEMQTQINDLKQALNDKTSSTFQSKIEESKRGLAAEKEVCQNGLNVLNGAFYKDPSSWLNRKWKAAAEAVNAAIGSPMKKRADLTKVSLLLDAAPASQAVSDAKSAIESFLRLEKQRDGHQKRLLEIISIEKADSLTTTPSLKSQLHTLQARQKELCGTHYQDPNSVLHKSWKSYKEAVARGKFNAEFLLHDHKVLELEQKTNAAQIIALQKQIATAAAPVKKRIQKIAEKEIRSQVKDLKAKRATEVSLAGVDWTKTAQIAASVVPTPFLSKEPLKVKG